MRVCVSLSLSVCVCMCFSGSKKRPLAEQQRHAPVGGMVESRSNDRLIDVPLEKVVAGLGGGWAIHTFQLLFLLFEVVFTP